MAQSDPPPLNTEAIYLNMIKVSANFQEHEIWNTPQSKKIK